MASKRMLIDASHAEETRVVVLAQDRIEEFDFEAASKRPLKGNIYLAKVTRVEPSLQAAFVEYGGNRHGFLSFSEIHPDYYRIPVADREALIREAAAMRDTGADEMDEPANIAAPASTADAVATEEAGEHPNDEVENGTEDEPENGADADDDAPESHAGETAEDGDDADGDEAEDEGGDGAEASADGAPRGRRRGRRSRRSRDDGDSAPRPTPIHRRYKIQEVIKRRQILLVQVQKEERGNKGAALTTYLSLAGRYCVLMPNTPRGGGVSRKIASAADRKRLKTVISDLKIPDGMAVIVRTAGSERTKTEIKRDYDYLLRLWEDIRQRTLDSVAPAVVHEESDIVRRAIRDLYQRDVDEVLVEGDEAYKAAKSFMKMLMPSHAKRVQAFRADPVPLFHKYRVEAQLDGIYQTTVQLRSGGYIVINPTEALVSIDVNSGRSTRERNIEDTALKTNLEAAEEIARQLRLRDLAGLIVIDFIDMEEARRNAQVERKLKDSLKGDRARIQVGRISGFGLMEMSRQRLRPSLQETAMDPCPHCGGTGFIRSVDSAALVVLRAIEDEGVKGRSEQIAVTAPTAVALHVLNEKRDALQTIEARYSFTVYLRGDDDLISPDMRIERVARTGPAPAPVIDAKPLPVEEEDTDEDQTDEAIAAAEASDGDGDDDGANRRRRRGRRGGRRRRRGAGDGADAHGADALEAEDAAQAEAAPVEEAVAEPAPDAELSAAAEQDAPAEVAAEAPKPRRRPRRRKAAAEGDAPTPANDADAAPAAVNDGAASETAEALAEEPKPKRRAPRRRKPAAAEAEPTADAEPIAAEPVAIAPEPIAAEAPADIAPAPAAAQDAEVADMDPAEDPARQPERNVSTELPEGAKPKRGFWNRVLG